MSPELERELKRLEEILRSSNQGFSLNAGASEAQIEAIGREVGFRSDDDLRSLYLYADGARGTWFAGHFYDPATYWFRSLEKCLQTWRDGFPYDDPDWRIPNKVWDVRIQPELLFHRRWFPFAEWNGFACCLHFDADPTLEGNYGQIIAADHDPDKVYYAAVNLAEFMHLSNDYLIANPYLLEERT